MSFSNYINDLQKSSKIKTNFQHQTTTTDTVMQSQPPAIQNCPPEVESFSNIEFPPVHITEEVQHRIITNYCKDMNPSNFDESGCAVCGGLTLINSSLPISDFSYEYLEEYAEQTTRIERKCNTTDPINYIHGPVIDKKCKFVCSECAESVQRKKLPKKAFGEWLVAWRSAKCFNRLDLCRTKYYCESAN